MTGTGSAADGEYLLTWNDRQPPSLGYWEGTNGGGTNIQVLEDSQGGFVSMSFAIPTPPGAPVPTLGCGVDLRSDISEYNPASGRCEVTATTWEPCEAFGVSFTAGTITVGWDCRDCTSPEGLQMQARSAPATMAFAAPAFTATPPASAAFAVPDAAEDSDAIAASDGPGGQLKKIIPRLFESAACDCNSYAAKMDRWGVAGCEDRFDEIVEHLVTQSKRTRAVRWLPTFFSRGVARRWVRQAIDAAREIERKRALEEAAKYRLEDWPFVWTYWSGGAPEKGVGGELWHSVQLVRKWHPQARCIVVGDRPAWFEGEVLEKPRIDPVPHQAFKDSYSKLLLAAEHFPQFIWMMDDVYWVRPFTIREAATPKYVRHVSQQRYHAWRPGNAWARTRAAAYEWLLAHNHPTYDFAAHLPQPIWAETFLANERELRLLDHYRNWECLYFNRFHADQAEDWGRKYTRINKPRSAIKTPHKVVNNTAPMWNDPLKEFLGQALSRENTPEVNHLATGRRVGKLTAADCSLIVTCKGRLDQLRQTIEAKLRQGAGEIILVDYECPDQSGAWAEANYPGRIKVVRPRALNPPYFNVAHARNCGARAARGKILVFIDADITPHDGWLAHMVELLNERPDAALLRTSYGTDAWDKCGTCAVPREKFFEARGYREAIDRWGWDDIDLYTRLEKIGPSVGYDFTRLDVIRHGDELRTAHFPEADRETGHQHTKYLSENAQGIVNPEGFGLMDPLARGVITSADANFFEGLTLLVQSIRETELTPLRCVDLGLTEEQRHWCLLNSVQLVDGAELVGRHVDAFRGVTDYWPQRHTENLWPKPYFLRLSPFRDTLWIDADAVVTRPLSELFGRLEGGALFTRDTNAPELCPNKPRLYELLPVPLVTDVAVNAGVLGLRKERDDDLLEAWIYCVEQAADRPEVRREVAWHDQGCLLWAIHKTGRAHQVLPGRMWNHTPHGYPGSRRTQRHRYNRATVLRDVRGDHPTAGIVHWMAAPKLWELLDE